MRHDVLDAPAIGSSDGKRDTAWYGRAYGMSIASAGRRLADHDLLRLCCARAYRCCVARLCMFSIAGSDIHGQLNPGGGHHQTAILCLFCVTVDPHDAIAILWQSDGVSIDLERIDTPAVGTEGHEPNVLDRLASHVHQIDGDGLISCLLQPDGWSHGRPEDIHVVIRVGMLQIAGNILQDGGWCRRRQWRRWHGSRTRRIGGVGY